MFLFLLHTHTQQFKLLSSIFMDFSSVFCFLINNFGKRKESFLQSHIKSRILISHSITYICRSCIRKSHANDIHIRFMDIFMTFLLLHFSLWLFIFQMCYNANNERYKKKKQWQHFCVTCVLIQICNKELWFLKMEK